MNWSAIFSSSVGKKFIMAVTGVFLIVFLVVHVGLNACIFANDNGEMFNKAAHFMGSHWLIRLTEIVLFVGIIAHAVQAYVLEAQNRSKRKAGYQVALGERGSKWYSRSMGLLGTFLLLFLIMHLAHFWVPARITGVPNETADGHHDMYSLMLTTFSNPVVVVLYVIGCISLAYHLIHGFQSAFRTLGVYNNRYIALIDWAGKAFSILVPLIFAAMPLSIYFGWLK